MKSLASVLAVCLMLSSATTAAAQAKKSAAAAAAAASPALIGQLVSALGSSKDQAAGAAGAMLSAAKSSLSPADFGQVSSAIPGADLLLKAAPAPGKNSTAGMLSQLGGSAGALASLAGAFSSLGLKPEMVSTAVNVLTSFVTKSGGANVGSLLANALK
jgi:hypothetical protein